MIQVEPRHWSIIKSILSRYPYQFYAFGSRATGTARKLSDLDLCYKEPIPDSTIVQIEGLFEDSDLPYKVDIVSWERCTNSFQKTIEPDLIRLTYD